MTKLILGLLAFIFIGYATFRFISWFIDASSTTKRLFMKNALVLLASLLIGGGLAVLFVNLF